MSKRFSKQKLGSKVSEKGKWHEGLRVTAEKKIIARKEYQGPKREQGPQRKNI